MTVLDVFLSMSWEYKIISLVIWGVVGVTIYLVLKTLKKPKSEILELLKTEEPSKSLDKPIPLHPDDLPMEQVDTLPETIPEQEPTPHEKLRESRDLRPYQREGIHGYTSKPRKGSEHELDIKRKAEELTKEEAWSELSESFWDTRREALKQFQPEIYKEIRYWETHLDDYNTRIGMMWVFGIPFGEHDLWVRRD